MRKQADGEMVYYIFIVYIKLSWSAHAPPKIISANSILTYEKYSLTILE